MKLNRLSVALACLLVGTLGAASSGGESPASPPAPSLGAVFASSDGGATFARTFIPDVSINALAADPTNSAIVYAATSAGIYKSSNSGVTWTRILAAPFENPGVIDRFTSLAIDPTAPCSVLAGVEEFIYWLIAVTDDCGVSWTYPRWSPNYGPAMWAVAVAPTSPRTVYFSGTTYPPIQNGPPVLGRCIGTDCAYFHPSDSVRVLAMDPADSCTVYAASVAGKVIRNTDCSDWNWSAVGGTLDSAIRTLAVHPTNQSTVFAGTETGTIYKFTSGTAPWVVKASLGAAVRGMVYNPADPSVLFAVAGSTLYRSIDSGESWSPFSALSGMLSSLATSASRPSVLYAGAFSSQAWMPVITSQPQSYVISPGTPATLSVVVTGTEVLNYQWYQGVSPNTASPIGGATSATYTTPPVNAPASYWVRVSNGAGSADSETATVSIGVPRTIALSGNLAFGNVLVNTTPSRTLTVSNTGTAALTVSGIAYPPGFSGAWAGVVAAGATQDVTVTFSPVAVASYGGPVTVAADQTGGTNTVAATGASGTPPDPPTDVHADAGYYGGVGVNFTAPLNKGGLPITGYTVTSNPAGGLDVTSVSTATLHLITGLTIGTAYTFSVVATNAVGSSAASAPSNSVTEPGDADVKHVTPANGATTKSTSPTLTWARSAAASYEYCIDNVNNGTCDALWTSTGTNKSVEVSGLIPETTYYWQVRATSASGTTYAEGDPAAYWTFTTAGASNSGPISPLYLVAPSLISVLQGTTVQNSWPTFGSTQAGTETSIAVTDVVKTLGVRIVGQTYQRYSASYSLAGDFLGILPANPVPNHEEDFDTDGTTDGTHHYSVGSISGRIYQFDANWDNSTVAFRIPGIWGIAHDSSNNSFWVSTDEVQNYSMAGALLSKFALSGSGRADSLALDPADSTLWVVRNRADEVDGLVLQQYSKQGELLGWLKLPNFQSFQYAAEFARPPSTPDAFFKISPTNWASGKSLGALLSWSPSTAATGYEYCIDTTNDNTCTGWINVGTNTSVSPGSLMANTTYFWQVRAIHPGGPSYADGNASRFWNFTTQVAAPDPFGKSLPANGAPAQPLSPVLSWQPAAGATSYQYCIDTTNDNTCNTGWVSVGNVTSVGLFALPARTAHYWQVRAITAGGTTYADGNAASFWSFATHARPESALNLNGDGRGDVFLYNSASGHWQRQLTQLDAGFSTGNGSWAAGWTVMPATFDRDGSSDRSDFFLFNPTSGAWFKMLGAGDSFVVQSNGTWWNGWRRHVMDLDGDGISDVFLYDPATGVWFKCISTPTGFAYFQGGWGPDWEIYPLTLNADGLGDMFIFNRTTGKWFWVLGAAGSGFTYPVNDVWFNGWDLYPGHFNTDKLSDLLLHDPATGAWFVAMNNGAGTGFTYTSGSWAPGWTPYVGDLDSDQDDDLFLHNPANGNWFELISTGSGGFTNGGGSTWTLGWNIYPTDLNGDGRVDILLYNPSTGVWYQARNLVIGTFDYSTGSWFPGWVVIVRNPAQ